MEYINRSLERKFTHMSEFFKAVLVTGARQVGKTWLMREFGKTAFEKTVYINEV